MPVAESILPEFDIEMASTRKTLERIPAGNLNWRAHEKSNTIGWVACHLAEIPGWVEGTLTQEAWDLNPPDGKPYETPRLEDCKAILELFDNNVSAARKQIAETADDEFEKPFSLLSNAETLFTLPKLGVIRTWVINHTIHHRAHLCVYLRLNNIPVPAIYGPSGDEQPNG